MPPLQDKLHKSETNGKQCYTNPVNTGNATPEIRWVFHTSTDHQDTHNAHRDINIKHPRPAVVIGEPSSQDGAHSRSEHDTHAEDGHGHTLLLRGIGLAQNSLGERDQTAP